MDTNTHNLYLVKALEAYPWELEKTMESLNYALSYEPENVRALALMGKVQIEQFKNHEAAKYYYERAIASDINFAAMYPGYVGVLVDNEEYDAAQRVIDFALKLKSVDKAVLLLYKATIFEKKEVYKAAKTTLKEACKYALNNNFFDYVDQELIRIKKKKAYQEKMEKTAAKAKLKEEKKKKKKAEASWFKNRLNNLL